MLPPMSPVRTAPPPPPPPPPEPEIEKVHDLVSDQGFLGHDRNEHMREIAGDLTSLEPARVNRTLDGLSTGDVRSFGEQIDHGGILGAQGLNGAERRDLFEGVAGKAGGPQLTRLSDGLNRGDKQDLADAVASRAPNQVKLDYVRAMAPATTRQDDQIDSGFGSSTLVGGSPEAHAVGTVLATLRGPAADAGFGSLDKPQLRAVAQAAEGETMTTTVSGMGAATSHSYDTRRLASLIDAAASGTDPAVKAQVFEVASEALTDIRGNDTLLTPDPTANGEARRVADALTGLLHSDTTGVVHALATDELGGQSLAAYGKEMVKEGRTADLGQVMAKLQHGNDLSEPDSAKYISEQRTNAMGQSYYANAQDLGYFSGAVEAGINSIISDRKTQADAINNVVSSTLFAAGATIPGGVVPAKVAVPLINGATRQTITSISADYANSDRDLRDTFNELALPRMGDTGERYRGPAEDAFLSYQNTVWQQNQ